MKTLPFTLFPILALAIFATALTSTGCSHQTTQRAPDLVAKPAPATPPQPDWLARTADGVTDVVTAPAHLLAPKPKVTKKPEHYEPADALIVTRGEEPEEEPATQPTTLPTTQPR